MTTPENNTILQGFEWYTIKDEKHWARLTGAVPKLRAIGITNIWIPPACKADNRKGNGYDIYDIFDLGEFNQKGGISTSWGDKAALLNLREIAIEHGVGLYFDAVLNHKAGPDRFERFLAVEVDPNNRNDPITGPYQIDGGVGFDFTGRRNEQPDGQPSSLVYHWYHFTGTNWNKDNGKSAIYQILGDNKHWSTSVSTEFGNYDYLSYADLDYAHPEVQDDVKKWGAWVVKELGLSGFRFDAVKHFSEDFLRDLIDHLEQEAPGSLFYVGEFWEDSLDYMQQYIARMDHKFTLFDVPLLYNFSDISKSNPGDLRKVYDDTLVRAKPLNAVTFVQNHDTQPGQSLEKIVEDFFKPLAYSLILLREEGYPCVFFGDLYGIRNDKGDIVTPPSCSGALPDLMLARKLYAYGRQDDYFDYPTCIGWVRNGTLDRPYGCAVVMSNSQSGTKRMAVGIEHKGEVWTDVLGWSQGGVTIGDNGFAEFRCGLCSVSVWVNKDAVGRDQFGKFDGTL